MFAHLQVFALGPLALILVLLVHPKTLFLDPLVQLLLFSGVLQLLFLFPLLLVLDLLQWGTIPPFAESHSDYQSGVLQITVSNETVFA